MMPAMFRDVATLIGAFALGTALATLFGASTLGVALTFGQISFAATLVWIMLRR